MTANDWFNGWLRACFNSARRCVAILSQAAVSQTPRERFINLCGRPVVLPLEISIRLSGEICFQFRRYKNLRGVA